jgi:hypothetical protein
MTETLSFSILMLTISAGSAGFAAFTTFDWIRRCWQLLCGWRPPSQDGSLFILNFEKGRSQ